MSGTLRTILELHTLTGSVQRVEVVTSYGEIATDPFVPWSELTRLEQFVYGEYLDWLHQSKVENVIRHAQS